MADAPVVDTKVTTDVQNVDQTVKAGSTLLGAPAVDVKKQPDPAADEAAAKLKAEADKGKTAEQIKAEADAATKADADKKAADDKAKGAPEKYEDFKLPDGVKLDEESLAEAQTAFKELNLPQGSAQKIMDLGVKHTAKVAAQLKQQSEKALSDAGEVWMKEIETDKEFGGAKFKASNEAALRFRDKFTTHEERKALAPLFDSGWGNFPVLWKMLVRGGLAIGEDRTIDGGNPVPKEQDAAKIMFPSMK